MANQVVPFPEPPPSHPEKPLQLICMIGNQRVVLNWPATVPEPKRPDPNKPNSQFAEVILFRKKRKKQNTRSQVAW